MKILILVILTLTFTFGYSQEEVKLRLSWKNQFQFAGYYIAKEKGFYKKVGIEVEIIEFDSNVNSLKEVFNGKTEFAVGRSSLLTDKVNENKITLLASIFQNSPLMLITQKNIKNIKDLKNGNIMITNDARISASILAMLSSNNINYKEDINIVKNTFNLNDFIDKKVDAYASYISNEPFILDNLNVKYNIHHPKDYGFDFYSDILYTSKTLIKKNPKMVKNFYEASLKGWEYAFNNINETSQIIYKKYNTQKKSLESLINEGEILKELAYNDKTEYLGCIKKERLETIINTYQVLGIMKENHIDTTNFIYSENHIKLYKKILQDKYMLFFGISVFAITIIIVLTIFFILKKRKWLVTKSVLEEEIKIKTKLIYEQTLLDPLTNIYNRKAYNININELLEEYNRNKTPFSIIYIDIDNFKNINDIYGHSKGDEILIKFTKIINDNLRVYDKLYRVGGEEFVVLLPNTSLQKSKFVADKLLKTIEENLIIDNNNIITASFGLTEVNILDDEKTIYQRVDKFLYHSKNNGKNQITYEMI